MAGTIPARSFHSTTSTKNKSQQQLPLSKRLLFPHLGTNHIPPLLAAQTTPPELTAELYDFIALALRAYITPWWSRITRYDKEFLPEINRIVTVVIRVLETRLYAMDMPSLVFRDIPTIITQHYADYRNAASKVSTSYACGSALSLPLLFHQLQPHMAVSPEGKIDDEYFRHIVDHILKTCLPPEDAEPEAERFIVREVILKVVLNDIIPKITQPWFIQKTILDLLGPSSEKSPLAKPPASSSPSLAPGQNPGSSFSFHTALVFLLSAIQSISGACLALVHAYKQTLSTIKRVNQTQLPPQTPRPPSMSRQSSDAPHIDGELEDLTPEKSAHKPLPDPVAPSPTPSPSPSVSSLTHPIPASSSTSSNKAQDTNRHSATYDDIECSHDYAFPPLAMVSEIFTTRDRYSSNIIMCTLGMLALSVSSFLDRLLPHFLSTTLSPQFTLSIVRSAKRTLFPNGYPAPAPPDPTLDEQAEIRERLVNWRGKGMTYLTPLLLGVNASSTLGAALDPLCSVECNVHLIVMIVDRIIVGLFPELQLRPVVS